MRLEKLEEHLASLEALQDRTRRRIDELIHETNLYESKRTAAEKAGDTASARAWQNKIDAVRRIENQTRMEMLTRNQEMSHTANRIAEQQRRAGK